MSQIYQMLLCFIAGVLAGTYLGMFAFAKLFDKPETVNHIGKLKQKKTGPGTSQNITLKNSKGSAPIKKDRLFNRIFKKKDKSIE
jgi:hypothetical protein